MSLGSQPFYKQELWHGMGYTSLEDFLVAFWKGLFFPQEANSTERSQGHGSTRRLQRAYVLVAALTRLIPPRR